MRRVTWAARVRQFLPQMRPSWACLAWSSLQSEVLAGSSWRPSPRRTIGQILVRMGVATAEEIRDVMARKIKRVVGEMLGWKTGTFDFAIDDRPPWWR